MANKTAVVLDGNRFREAQSLDTIVDGLGLPLGGTGGLSDGDYGDITVSVLGTVMTIDNDAVTYAKMQNVSAASKLLGRGSAGGAGNAEEITLGTNLSMSGTTLNASGGSGGGMSALLAAGF